MTFEEKKKKLLKMMADFAGEDCVIAFSGGVDSSLLVRLACEQAKICGTDVYAVMIQSELAPENDLEIAGRVAAEFGAIFVTLKISELSLPGIAENSLERCYICKKYLFTSLLDFAGKKGINTVIEGTNGDDLHVYRPGIRAVRELGIKSPLAALEITKAQVRSLASEYKISVADRPSAPCLATRFPYGTHLSGEALRNVEKGEIILHNMGFNEVRLRVHENIARIEVPKEAMHGLLLKSGEITQKIKALGYDYVTLDLEGFRSGSMDIHRLQQK